MAHLHLRTYIAAPPQTVWRILADLEHQAAWMRDVRSIEVTTRQTHGVGTILRVRSDLFGLPLVRDVMEITAWDPPRRMDVRHSGDFTGAGQFLLTPLAGGTLFTWAEHVAPPLGSIGERVFAIVIRPHLLRVFARSMSHVRSLAETPAAPAVPPI